MNALTFPLAPAEKYADGGYPLAYVMDDGELLCAGCMNDPTNPVHAGGDADGWRLEGIGVLYETNDGDETCAHCGAVILEETT
jgi:hypothetical protein